MWIVKIINQMQRHEMEWKQPHKIPKDEKWNENNFILYFAARSPIFFCFSCLANNLKRRFAEFSADVRPWRHCRILELNMGMGIKLGGAMELSDRYGKSKWNTSPVSSEIITNTRYSFIDVGGLWWTLQSPQFAFSNLWK